MNKAGNTKADVGLTSSWALLAALCLSPLYFIFRYFDDSGRGLAATLCAIAVTFAARNCWEFKKYIWFWITIVFLVALQVPIVLLIPWTNRSYPAAARLPFVALDYGIALGCIKLVAKVMDYRMKGPSAGSS